jgi:low temperature requirement protein LtrA
VSETGARAERVTTLELFFDLVFVFTITQLSAYLARELTWGGLLRVAIMLGVVWWMYGGYAWLTNAVSTERAVHRALLLGGMCGYLLLALAIPDAFSGGGLAFGIGYLVVNAVHTWLFVYGSSDDIAKAFMNVAPFNAATAAMVLAGGALGGTAQVVLWALVLLEWIVPHLSGIEGFEIAPAHFVERHGLVIIVAIGESVVAIGIGAAGIPVDVGLALVAVLGLLLSAGLWWTYFGGDDEAAERALRALPVRDRPLAALDAFGLAHLALLLGIVALAVGLKKATGHAYDPLHDGPALALAGGAALFLAGDVAFRWRLRLGRSWARAAAAVIAPATIPLGTEVAAVAQIAALTLVVALAAAPQNLTPPALARS